MTTHDLKWWHRLSVRLTALIAAVTLATIGIFVVLGIQSQQEHLISEVVRGAALFSDTIKSSTYYDMLEDRRDDAYRIMETIGRQEGIEKVRIFNKEGRVTFSTDRGEIDTYVDKKAESCYACHTADQPIVRLNIPSRSRVYRAHDGHRILGMVTPIYNEPSCSGAACHVHPVSQTVIGVVDIGISLSSLDQDVSDLRRRTILLGLVVVSVLAAMVILIARTFVVRPVNQLVEATQKIALGDLGQMIPVHRSDELGQLSASFNQMTQALGQAREHLQQLMESLERQVEERTAALRETQAQLVQSEKMSSLGKLSASIAHEINNPLSGILTYAKLLKRQLNDGPPDDATRVACIGNLSLVQRETERCSAIVRSLLDFARQRPLELTAVRLVVVIDEALSLVANQISIQNIALRKQLEEIPPVKGDFGQLRQAFVNVLLNACEAMPQGGTLNIACHAAAGSDMAEVAIHDTGTGIAADDLPKILDPFFTTKERGTGLGLSVVYGIIERHGGKLEITSRVGQGTRVLIRVPLVQLPATSADAGSSVTTA